MHDPSLSQSRLLIGYFMGTLSPSRRHRRSTLCRSTAILHLSAWLRPDDKRNTHTDGPVRSCPEPDAPHRLGTSEHSGASSDAASRPGRRGVRKHRTDAAPGRYSCVAARGLEVSLRGFTQNEFIQCEIGHSSAKAFVLLLQSLQLFELIRPHTTVLLAPTIIRLFRNLNLANSVNSRRTLPVCR